jgi:biopolymer transport protein ExbD
MIDVGFLLLAFFMLTAQFARDQVLDLGRGQGGAGYAGPPRLVQLGAGQIWLNGQETDQAGLLAGLAGLAPNPDDVIVLRGAEGADLQRLVDLMQALRDAGHVNLVLVE